MNKTIRSKVLEFQGITCDCIACKNGCTVLKEDLNFEPLPTNLESKDLKNLKETYKLLKYHCEILSNYSFDSQAANIINKNINFILRSIAAYAQFPV